MKLHLIECATIGMMFGSDLVLILLWRVTQ